MNLPKLQCLFGESNLRIDIISNQATTWFFFRKILNELLENGSSSIYVFCLYQWAIQNGNVKTNIYILIGNNTNFCSSNGKKNKSYEKRETINMCEKLPTTDRFLSIHCNLYHTFMECVQLSKLNCTIHIHVVWSASEIAIEPYAHLNFTFFSLCLENQLQNIDSSWTFFFINYCFIIIGWFWQSKEEAHKI